AQRPGGRAALARGHRAGAGGAPGKELRRLADADGDLTRTTVIRRHIGADIEEDFGAAPAALPHVAAAPDLAAAAARCGHVQASHADHYDYGFRTPHGNRG